MFKYSKAFITNNKKEMIEIIITKNILNKFDNNTNIIEL